MTNFLFNTSYNLENLAALTDFELIFISLHIFLSVQLISVID